MWKYGLVCIGLVCNMVSLAHCQQKDTSVPVSLFDKEPVILNAYGRLNLPSITESSGLVKSRSWDNVFWTHNDSGGEPRIFPVRRDGTIIKPEWAEGDYNGIVILDAVNIDWEDITTDNQGNLIIGAFGNNSNNRQDLAIYLIKEPYPFHIDDTRITLKIAFRYPDQEKIPPVKRNFDAEAIFWARNKIYILTKHRSDSFTKLYRFDSMDPLIINTLTLVSSFDIKGQVTGADASPDGKKLVVLTYNAVWLFDDFGNADDYFNGKISWLPIEARQCEGICFDDDMILISNEQRDLFELSPDSLVVVKKQ